MRFSWFATAIVAATVGLGAPALGSQRPELTPEQAQAAATAAATYDRGDYVSALKLYDQLAADVPLSWEFSARLASCMVSTLATLPTGDERTALVERARSEVKRARGLGAPEEVLRVAADALANPRVEENPWDAKMAAAEAAFARGDSAGALAGYLEIAAAEPTNYESRLFAGDCYFQQGDAVKAGEWYAKAITVDPNRETAYRYWGDVTAKRGHPEEALKLFIDAIVAEPYTRRPWDALGAWARANKATLAGPVVHFPPAPGPGKDGGKGATLNVDDTMMKDPNAFAFWLLYSVTRADWRSKKFAEQFPNEKEYRHSLIEEISSLEAAFAMRGLDKPGDKAPEPLRDLERIKADGLLAEFVLISNADAGLAQDYAGYRAEHRESLHRYIERYLVHRKG